jgi:hypothetical protein
MRHVNCGTLYFKTSNFLKGTCVSAFPFWIPFWIPLWIPFWIPLEILFWILTAIPYRASTGPEQGFPCEVFQTGKYLFS